MMNFDWLLTIYGSLESPQCLLFAFALKFWEVAGTYKWWVNSAWVVRTIISGGYTQSLLAVQWDANILGSITCTKSHLVKLSLTYIFLIIYSFPWTSSPKPDVWIGAHKVAPGQYKFTDGSTYDYLVPNEDIDGYCLVIVNSTHPDGRACETNNYQFICMSKALNYKGQWTACITNLSMQNLPDFNRPHFKCRLPSSVTVGNCSYRRKPFLNEKYRSFCGGPIESIK